MKLRNFVYAAMIACAFASCSKDDENVPTPDGGDASATLEVKIESPALTKSISGAANEDMKISDLYLYVFNKTTQAGADADYELEQVAGQAAGQAGPTTSVLRDKLTAGDKKVVVLANYAPVANVGTTLADFKAMTKEIDANEITNGKLSMNSKVYEVALEAGKRNYLGYKEAEVTSGKYLSNESGNTVKLYRNVAKVVLNKLTFAPKPQYGAAEFFVDSVFILHGAKTTKIVGLDGNEWGATEVKGSFYNGVTEAAYKNWINIVDNIASATWKQSALKNGGYDSKVFTSYDGKNYQSVKYVDPISLADSFYVYENLNTENGTAKTLLVVAGKMNYGTGANKVTGERRYYSVAVGIDNVNGEFPTLNGITRIGGVIRNLQYNVDLTVTGPGWDTPFGPDQKDNTALDVKVEVVKFGQVSQSSVIE